MDDDPNKKSFEDIDLTSQIELPTADEGSENDPIHKKESHDSTNSLDLDFSILLKPKPHLSSTELISTYVVSSLSQEQRFHRLKNRKWGLFYSLGASFVITLGTFMGSIVIRGKCLHADFVTLWTFLVVLLANLAYLGYKYWAIREYSEEKRRVFSPIWPLSDPVKKKTFVVMIVS